MKQLLALILAFGILFIITVPPAYFIESKSCENKYEESYFGLFEGDN